MPDRRALALQWPHPRSDAGADALAPASARRRQFGAAALTLTMLLSIALALGALALHQAISVEQQRIEQQLRSARAFEAAEAGLAWAQAQLNHPGPVDAACRAATDANANPIRALALTWPAAPSSIGAIGATGWQARCVQSAGGWSCRCAAADGAPVAAPGTAFSLGFQALAIPGQVRVVAQGCDRPAAECGTPGAGAANATATTTVDLALVPGMLRAPATALSVRDAGRQSIDEFFAGFFGLDPTTWLAQPAAARVLCPAAECGDAIAAAIAGGADLIAIDGDAQVAGPRTFGSVQRPIVLVARGALRIDGAVQVVGVLYGGSVTLVTPGEIRGALLTAGTYAGPSPGARLDPDVLATLQQRTGSFARVAASWRDF